ncbi:MAG: sigma-70 family RNA polymerase sigma factor, partial [Bdellovibrionales bacterium]|nr:sigma-70 family RNA polymerase sigma factor [Bdellovibrionales bacterium]
YDCSREFLPWLWSILRSTFSDSLRREVRNPARANVSEESARDQWESIPTPSDESQSTLSIAAELLERLPEDQKQLIEMRTKQGLSFEEIASRLSISSAAARQRFSRLVQNLKGKLS